MVWKLDRLSRSLRDVLTIIERLAEEKAGFRSLTEAIDTTTPAGRMMFRCLPSSRNLKSYAARAHQSQSKISAPGRPLNLKESPLAHSRFEWSATCTRRLQGHGTGNIYRRLFTHRHV